MFAAVGIIALLVLIGWLVHHALSSRKAGRAVAEAIRPHTVMYGLSCVAGVCSLAFFLDMDSISKLVKVVVCILLGIALIFLAAWLQRKAQTGI
jgi:dipeptide/tripeptide permease